MIRRKQKEESELNCPVSLFYHYLNQHFSVLGIANFCIPIIIHTDTTKGAVRVVIPKLIPIICNTTDSKTEHEAHTRPSQLLSPKAMAHNTPL